MTARPIITDQQAASCYFRTTVDFPNRKALVQICEPCNMLCGHCFVNATKRGTFMSVAQVRERLIPQLLAARVKRVTVTGGEPFVHEDVIEIIAEFRAADMSVGVCTNGTGVSDEDIRALVELDAHMSVTPSWTGSRRCWSVSRTGCSRSMSSGRSGFAPPPGRAGPSRAGRSGILRPTTALTGCATSTAATRLATTRCGASTVGRRAPRTPWPR